jgi:ferrous iron transport protein A
MRSNTTTRKGGNSGEQKAVPLSALGIGEHGTVVDVGGGRRLLSRMTSLGFTPGVDVAVVQNYGHGPIIACVRNARIALGRGEAGRILVRRAGV